MNCQPVHNVLPLTRARRKIMRGIRALCIALLISTAPMAKAFADCPAAPIGSADDLVVSFLAANGAQVASSTLLPSSVKEGMLVYDDTDDTLKICDGDSWIEVGSGSSGGGSASASGPNGYVQLTDGTNLVHSSESAGQQLFWDRTNHRLGIGTASPIAPLHVASTGIQLYLGSDRNEAARVRGTPPPASGPKSSFVGGDIEIVRSSDHPNYWDAAFRTYTYGAGHSPLIVGVASRGTIASPDYLVKNDPVVIFRGVANDGLTGSMATDIKIQADEDHSSTSAGTAITFSNVLNGSLSKSERLRIAGSGNIGIGTTTPQSLLHVAGGIQLGDDTATCPGTSDVKLGTMRFSGGELQLCKSGGWSAVDSGNGGNGTVLSVRETLALGTVYGPAATDGLVLVSGQHDGASGIMTLSVNADTSNPPTTSRAWQRSYNNGSTYYGTVSLSVPVRKGEYYRILCNSAANCGGSSYVGGANYYFIPMTGGAGSGSDTLAGLSCSSGQVPSWNGTLWECADMMGGGSTVAFYAHRGGTNQTVSANAYTKILYMAERFDEGGAFDTTTSQFKPAIPGKYLITVRNYCSGSSTECDAVIYKNGAIYSQGWTGGTSALTHETTAIVDMNGTTDYVEGYVYNQTTTLSGDPNRTYMTGALLGGGTGGSDTLAGLSCSSGQVPSWNGSAWGCADMAGGSVPTGTIAAFAAASCPSGWTEYTAARGRFLRGIDNGAGNDPDGTRAPGHVQADALQDMSGTISGSQDYLAGTGAFSNGTVVSSSNRPNSGTASSRPVIFNASNVARTSTETRPKNVAVIFCEYSGSGGGGGGATTLAALTDVDLTGLSNGMTLVYDSVAGKWEATAGGNVTPAGNDGSIQFKSGSDLAADAANLHWDDTNKRLGIGTATPGTMLHILGTSASARLSLSAPATENALIDLQSKGTDGLVNSSGSKGWRLNVRGDNHSNTSLQNAFSFDYYDNTVGANYFTIMPDGRVGIGTTTPKGQLQVLPAGQTSIENKIAAVEDYYIGAITTGTSRNWTTLHLQGAYGSNLALWGSGNPVSASALKFAYASRSSTNENDATVAKIIGAPVSTDSDAGGFLRFETRDTAESAPKERLRITESGNVGIGTSVPSYRMVISGNAAALPPVAAPVTGTLLQIGAADGQTARMVLDTYGNGSTAGANFSMRSSGGTAASPSASAHGDILGQISFMGYGDTSYSTARASIRATAMEAWTDTAQGTRLDFNTTDIGATDNPVRMSIAANGGVGIGTTQPRSKLHVAGGIQLADDAATCPGTGSVKLGTLKYASDVLSICNSTGWTALGAGGGSVSGSGAANHIAYWSGTSALAHDANQLYWDASTNRLGIGTSAPAQALHVMGRMQLETTLPQLVFRETDATADNKQWKLYPSDEEFVGTATNDADSVGSVWMRVRRTGVTINSVAFPTGNIGIGTTTPFHKFQVAGGPIQRTTTDFDNTTTGSNIFLNLGAQTGSTYGILGTATTGGTVAGNLAIMPYGGRVGIGTTSPGAKLQIDEGTLRLRGAFDGTNQINFYPSGAGEQWEIYPQPTGIGIFNRTDTAFRFWIGNDGNVGIGTSSPSFKLDIGGTAADEYIGIRSDSRAWRVGVGQVSGDDKFIVRDDTGGSTRLTIDTNGNVGIGTTSPSSPLHVAGNVRAAGTMWGNSFISSATGASGDWRFSACSSAGDSNCPANGAVIHQDGVATRLAIMSGGNVGIGTTAPTSKLDVAGQIKGTSPTAGGGGIGGYAMNGTVYGILGYNNAWGVVCNGTSCGGTAAWTNYSDARLKERVKDLSDTDGLSTIMRLRPVRFHWRDAEQDYAKGEQLGLIAQDVQKILPEVLGEPIDSNIKLPDGREETIKGTLNVSYATLVVPLIKAVQELKAANDNLKAANDNLRAELRETTNSQDAQIETLRREIEAMKAAR